MKILKKLFCLHQWKTHNKNVNTIPHFKSVKIEDFTYRMCTGQDKSYKEYTITIVSEVMICNKCGKVKVIDY